MVSSDKGLSIIDYAVLIAVITISFGIGLYQAVCRKVSTPDQYLMGGRTLSVIPVAISLLISFISAISILGNSAETYFFGVNYYFILCAYVVAPIITSLTFVPLFYPLKLTSINEYFYMRYKSKSLVYISASLLVISNILTNGIVLYGPALMIESMIGIQSLVTLIGLGLLSTIYTTLGGLRGVIWSDVFQALVIFGGLFTIVILGTWKVGGITEVWKLYGNYDRLQIEVNPLSRSSATAFGIGISITFSCFLGVTPQSFQRYCSLPNQNAAKRSFWTTIPITLAIQTLTSSTGVVVFAYFAKINCDPYAAGEIHSVNEILPYYIEKVLHFPPLPGAFIACVFCGSLSNLSSMYSALAAVVWQDIVSNFLGDMQTRRKTYVTKFISFSIGILTIAAGHVMLYNSGTLIQMVVRIGSICTSPLITAVLCGALSRRCNYKSAYAAATVALVVTATISMSSLVFHPAETYKPLPSDGCFNQNNTELQFIMTPTILPSFTTNSTDQISLDEGTTNFFSWLATIPYPWLAPLGVLFGLLTGLSLCFIPGFYESSIVDDSLLFHFLRGGGGSLEYTAVNSKERTDRHALNDFKRKTLHNEDDDDN